MVFVFVVILICLIVLWVFTRITKPDTPDTNISYSIPFLRVAVQLLRWYQMVIKPKSSGGFGSRQSTKRRQLETSLQILHPSETSDSQMYRFQVEKLSMGLLVIFIGSVLGLLILIRAEKGRILTDNNEIHRNDINGMDVEADLIAGVEDYDGEMIEEQIDFVVPARKYSDAEVDKLFETFSQRIDEVILGKNDKADHIVFSLNLVKSIDGYPFTINWECSNYELLDTDGNVHNEELEEPVMITIMGDCIYEHKHWYLNRTLRICPQELTKDELIFREIMSSLQMVDEQTRSEFKVTLPENISSGTISWKEEIKDDSYLIVVLVVILCALISPIKEAEVNSQIKKRAQELLADYSGFVSKLTLYMGAGMSVRNCFIRLGMECKRMPEKTYLAREIIITAHELGTGISELEAYEHFGKRCGNREYMRLSALITQNLRKGSTDLMQLLLKESEEAFILRKNEARKLGEEASTKLLLPMIMMLAIVMVIIMVPAYMSFSS